MIPGKKATIVKAAATAAAQTATTASRRGATIRLERGTLSRTCVGDDSAWAIES
jgi:hypothetical protein